MNPNSEDEDKFNYNSEVEDGFNYNSKDEDELDSTEAKTKDKSGSTEAPRLLERRRRINFKRRRQIKIQFKRR